ncbi:calcineurin-like phosphoesterase family protein [Methylobacterium sp. WL120]|uniref:calcineurin-like phosphoesterase C-terminal domain-containing protein n=1 Tax=Methylobacterium sp. WL120 TaxID=2603887 RepID=UPI001FF06B27|nr:calcineurin-like phosphoesterase family protein [Methylobacterium sp. WL120]
MNDGIDDMASPLTRRAAVSGLGAIAATLAAPAFARGTAPDRPEGSVTASGFVFEDRSGAGRRQIGDPGLPGVAVSNGRDVVRTDESGRYSLAVSDGDAVFVVKPSGYRVPLDANNLPRVSYIHRPDGTPTELGFRYPGLAPTGALPESLDFPLRRVDEPSAFDVLLFTDPQPASEDELAFVRDTALTSVLGTSAAFGMTMGDIVSDDLSLYPRYNRMIGRAGIPWWHVGGNHDLNFEAPDADLSRETFKRVYGAPYYAFEHGQALFLMLDNVRYLGIGTAAPGARGGRYEGRFGDRQLTFVENILRDWPKDRLVVVGMHIPLITDWAPADPANTTVDRDALLALLAGRPSLSVAGHTHTTEHHYLGGDGTHHHHVLTAVSGSWWSGPYDRRGIACADSRDGTPNGYHVLSIDAARYTTRFVVASEPDRAMRITLDSQYNARTPELARTYTVERLLGSPIPVEAVGSTDLVVNVFDGGPRTRVTLRLGTGRAAISMVKTRQPDPFVTQVYARNADTKKPWVSAIPSSHVWVARLPSDLGPGTHRADVEVLDEYGRARREAMIIEVTGA